MKKELAINQNVVSYDNLQLKMKKGVDACFNVLLNTSVIVLSLILLYRAFVIFMGVANYYYAISLTEMYGQLSMPIAYALSMTPVLIY